MEEKAINTTLIEKIEILMSNYENHYNNISIQEISNQLGISVNTLRNHLSKDKTNAKNKTINMRSRVSVLLNQKYLFILSLYSFQLIAPIISLIYK